MNRTLPLLALCLLTFACEPEAGGDTESIAQCPGNHPDSSLAMWLQAAQQDLGVQGATITSHPSRNCVNIAVSDSTRFPEIEAALQRLAIPRDAVVLSPEP